MSKVTEAVTQSDTMSVDKEAGIIRGVRVCGCQSKNGRLYPVEVLESAKSLYEGVSVYLDHGLEPGDEREIDDHFGSLRNVHIKEGAMYADLHYLKSHSKAAAIVERAERFPNNFGLSHDVEIEAVREGDTQRVTRITGVNSVDIVTRPATNNGIFEQETPVKKVKRTYKQVLESLSAKRFPGKYAVLEEMEVGDDPMLQQPIEMTEEEAGGSDAAIKAGFRTMIMAVLDDPNIDNKSSLKKIGELLKQQEKLMSGGDATTTTPTDPALEEEGEDDQEKEVVEAEMADSEEQKKVEESWKKRALAAEQKNKQTAKRAVVESVIKQCGAKKNERLVRILESFGTKDEMVAYLEGDDVGGVIESQHHPIYAITESEVSGDYKPAEDYKSMVERCRTFQ